jgi:hypothetical protein
VAVIITPEGYYAGAGNYQDYVHFLKNEEIIEIDSFKEKFNKPEIIRKVLKGESIDDLPKIETINFNYN